MASRHLVIALVDLDGFYAAVETAIRPELAGIPLGVMQYNPFGDLASHGASEDRVKTDSNGSLIAVSYEARAFGVKRNMRGDEAVRLCPHIKLVQVPTAHGKADLTLYREWSLKVMEILGRSAMIERASVDECYLDLTEAATRRLRACVSGDLPLPMNLEEMHICGLEGSGRNGVEEWWSRPASDWDNGEQLLACGAAIVSEARAAVCRELGFTCSAGIAHTKVLAKLTAGMHKPCQQTILPSTAVAGLLESLPIGKLRALGGKLGQQIVQLLDISTVGELAAVPLRRLEELFGEADGLWLHRLAQGIDDAAVKPRLLPKSISCSKTFRGPTALRSMAAVHHWLLQLGTELQDRVATDRASNARLPQLLTVHFSYGGSGGSDSISRQAPLRRCVAKVMADDAGALIKRWEGSYQGVWAIQGLGLGVSNFTAAPTGSSTIARFLKPLSGGAHPALTPAPTPTPAPAPTPRPTPTMSTPASSNQKGTLIGIIGQHQSQTSQDTEDASDLRHDNAQLGHAASPSQSEQVVRGNVPGTAELGKKAVYGPAGILQPSEDIEKPQPSLDGRKSLSLEDTISRDSESVPESVPESAPDKCSASHQPQSLSEISADVMSALPLSLQAEIRASMRDQHRLSLGKKRARPTGLTRVLGTQDRSSRGGMERFLKEI